MLHTGNLSSSLRERMLHVQRLLEGEKGSLYFNWIVRMAALVGLVLYFVTRRVEFDPGQLQWIKLTLFAYFVYNVLSGFLGTLHSEWFMHTWVKLAQFCFEILIYSSFYLLSGDPRADIYFFYFIPLFFAVHFLSPFPALAVIAFEGLNLYGVVLHLTGLPIAGADWLPLGGPLASIFWPRFILLLAMSLAYAIRRRTPLALELQDESTAFRNLFQSLENGVFIQDKEMRLVYVNQALQERHGPYTRGQPSSEYFRCEVRLFAFAPARGGHESEALTATSQGAFVDRNGNDYHVEVNLIALESERGQVQEALGIVKDLDQPRRLEKDLMKQLQRYGERVKTLLSQRTLWQETYVEMGKRLAGFDDPQELMNFVVSETRKRLNAETSSLFLLNGGGLYRQAIAGVEADWLAEECYQLGEGITGQVIQAGSGSKYGQAVRRNRVGQDPQVVSKYLDAYQEHLKTHQVRHLMAVPLNGQDRSFGVLRVVNKLDRGGRLIREGFDADDQDFLVTIASMAAIALENNRLLKTVQLRYQQVNTVYAIQNRVNSVSDWVQLGQVIVDEVRSVIHNAAKSSIYLVDEASGHLVLQAVSPQSPSKSSRAPLRAQEGIAGRAIRNQRVEYVPDTAADPDFVDRGEADLHALLVAPLLVGARVVGILSVDSSAREAFAADDIQLLSMVAAQAAMALEKGRLYKQEQERRLLADSLLEVSRKINTNLNLRKMLPEILNELAHVIPYSSISIQVLEAEQLKIVACRGFDDRGRVMRLKFPLSDAKYPNGRVIRTKAPLRLDDVRRMYPHFQEEAEKFHSGHIRSWMGVPLIYRGRVIGMLSLDHHQAGFYTPEMEGVALTFANQVAIAIANANLFREQKAQMENLDKLFQVSRAVASSIKLEDVLVKIVTMAKGVSASDHSGVVLLDENGGLNRSYETETIGQPLHLRTRPEGVTNRVIEAAKPLFFNKVKPNDRRHNPVILQSGFRSYGGLPITASGKTLGVLFVHSYKPNRYDRRKVIPMLEMLCNQAAIAIENALLYEQVTGQTRMLERLVEVSSGLIQHTSLKELVEYCANQAAEIFEVEDCSLYLHNKERKTIDLVYSSAIPPEVWDRKESPLDAPGLTAFVARTGECLNFGGDEYRRHPAWSGHAATPFLEHLQYLPSGECQSLLIGPLKDSQGQVVGVLKLENRKGAGRGRRFSEFEQDMHGTFASHVGTAIERARLYEQLDDDARKAARRALSYDLHDISNLIHGALVMRLEVAREKLARDMFMEVGQELVNISKAAQTVHSLLRWIHYGLRGDDVLQEKGLVPALEHIADLLKIPLETQVLGREALPLEIEYALYKIGLEALVNTAKHAGDHTRASLRLAKDQHKFTFEIEDNGFGFDKTLILQRPYRYGLNSMQRWADTIGAEFDFQSQPRLGTVITVTGKVQPAGAEK
jgi:GAF domain-containing protein